MIKIMEGQSREINNTLSNTKFLLTGNLDTEILHDGELIPIVNPLQFDLKGKLIPPTISINELGKQLLKAAGEGNVDEIRMLMNKGAPFTADWLGTSPLHLAAQNNHLEVCEILLRAGISKDAITKVSRTPLHMAAYEGHVEIVECLLKHGADYDCRDMLEMTPLHWAAQNGHADAVTILIRYGATTNPVNKFELTPSDLALQIKRPDIVEIINIAIRDPLVATQHLQLEMTSDSNDTMDAQIEINDTALMPMESITMEEIDSESSVDPEKLNLQQNETEIQIEDVAEEIEEQQPIEDTSVSDSIRYLQEHGITMLPADDSNILSTVMETGHSVVLTEVGKQVLNSFKQTDTNTKIHHKPIIPKTNNMPTLNMKKVITVTPEDFLAMTQNGSLSSNFMKHVNNGKFVAIPKNNVKRIVMKRNKTTPITATVNMSKVQKLPEMSSDIETLQKQLAESQKQLAGSQKQLAGSQKQLAEARKLIEGYKIKVRKQELELDRYKQQFTPLF